jgi:primosomal protein N' (replication factor Y)
VPTLLEIKPFTLSKGLGAGVEKIEAPFLKRLDSYQNYISDTYTVLLVVPTQVEADDWSLRLKKYSPLVLSGKLTGERREAALTRARSSDDIPRIIIATPGFVWVPIPNLCRIVIERASAGSYSLPKRPYLDLRYALAALARERAIPLTYGDYPLPLEYRDDPNSPLTKIIGSIEVIDVRTPKTEKAKAGQTNTKPTWKAVPDTFITQIKETLSTGGRVAVLAARRGYAPTVVCGDCGTAVADEHGRALSLATEKGVRVFRSSDGTVSQGADVFCKNCGGWNLNPLGIGIERVEEELRLAFPDTLLVRISEESKRVASLKKVRAEIDTAGTIIIGTEMMLPWISPDMPVDLGIIASADSLLALPFWRSD